MRNAAPTTACSVKLCGMLCVYSCLKEQIRQLERRLLSCARENACEGGLMHVPGVGVLTALAFVTAVDDPAGLRGLGEWVRTSA